MKQTSDLYKQIESGNHWYEVSLVIGDGVPENGYRETSLGELTTDKKVFSNNTFAIGGCVAGELTAKLILPATEIPKMAKLRPYYRITNGTQHSEWLAKGTFYIDSRKVDDSDENVKWLELRGFDAMLFAEQDCPEVQGTDREIVEKIAKLMGVDIEEHTLEMLTESYLVSIPAGDYSQREVLGYIAAAYGGCFIINDGEFKVVGGNLVQSKDGELQLIILNNLPSFTPHLVTPDTRRNITFGGVRIRV